jgi:hypothetical protein
MIEDSVFLHYINWTTHQLMTVMAASSKTKKSEKKSILYKKLKQGGFCVRCRKPRDEAGNNTYCGKCRAVRSAAASALRKEKKARGECKDCSEPAALNSIYCEKHHKKAKQSLQLYLAKTAADPNRNLTPEKARAHIETCRARIRKNESRIAELEEYLRDQEKI